MRGKFNANCTHNHVMLFSYSLEVRISHILTTLHVPMTIVHNLAAILDIVSTSNDSVERTPREPGSSLFDLVGSATLSLPQYLFLLEDSNLTDTTNFVVAMVYIDRLSARSGVLFRSRNCFKLLLTR